MDRFNEYWELLSDKSIPIGKELITYYKTLHENEDGSPLSERSCSFLLQNLLINPYPTSQLLRLLATSKIPLKNNAIREICDAGMVDFLETYKLEDVDKFYNLISNNLLSTDAMNHLVPVVLRMLREQKIDRELLMLALISRKSQKMLKHFLKQMDVTQEQQYLLETIDGKRHFLSSVLNAKDIPFLDPTVRDYIRWFQLVAQINTAREISSIPVELQLPEHNFLRMYFLEIKRTQVLQGLFEGQEDPPQIQHYAKESSVIALYLKKKLKIVRGYDQLLEVIAENDRLNRDILRDYFPGADQDHQSEDAKLLHMLVLWQYVMDVMKLSPQLASFETVLESRVTSIRTVLKSVENTETFVELLESLITLLFVRYEHLPQKPYGPVGFMCSRVAMEAILNNLKLVTTHKIMKYINADDELKLRLTNCMEIINDALWRLSLFCSISTNNESPLQLTDTDSGNIITKLPDLVQDDEEHVFHSAENLHEKSHKYSTFPKKRHSKRRPPLSHQSSSGSTVNKTMQHSLPLPSKIDVTLDSSITTIVTKPKSIFSKMLGTPEKLATVCLVNKNLEAAKTIIKNNNLGATPVGHDLNFLENFTQIQEKLAVLIANYDRMQHEQSLEVSGGSMLDDIRSRTAIGFEASKIISTIETFSSGQKIQQTEEDLQLLQKYTGQYPFLELFRRDALRNIHAMDLLLGLPMGYDLNLSLYSLVSKCLDKSDCGDGRNYGYISFLKRLIDDLQLFRNGSAFLEGRSVTFHRLLGREVCPLDPNQLGPVLEARRSVASLNSLEDVQRNDRKGKWSVFKKIQTFLSAAEKLLKLHGDWQQPLTADDIVRMDLPKIISDLAFERRVPLNELEPLVKGTNLNLIHILARNYLGEVGKPLEYDIANHPEVLEYISEKNQLIGVLLREIVGTGGGCSLLKNLKDLPSVNVFEPLYNCRMSAVLNSNQHQLDCLSAETISGDLLRLEMLDHVSVRCNLRNIEQRQTMRHEIISKLLESDNPDQEIPIEMIVQNTQDVNLKAEYLLKCIGRLPNAVSIMELIKCVLLSKNAFKLAAQSKKSLESWLFKLQIYVEIGASLENEDWRSVQQLSLNNKELVLHQLIQKNLYDLCSRWIRIHPLKCDDDGRLSDIFTLAVMKASTENEDCNALFAIVEGMSQDRVVRFYETILLGVKNEDIIKHTVEYLEMHGENRKIYQKYRISLEIFKHLPSGDSKKLWNLISRPLLIIEQYLMNSKLELLGTMMGSIRPLLMDNVCQICYEQREYIRDLRSRITGSINLDSSHDDQFITKECFDCLLRIYAGKALDYRVSNDSGTSGESMQDQSMDFSSLDSLCEAFVMPREVPTKDGWVRDEDASHCMCCRRSVFSMLNRRHHCRRCGRVVCHACSKKKLEIPELYEDVPVRACDDCVKQSQARLTVPLHISGKTAANSDSDEWQLTGNVRNDNIIREEYSYEYAPSTSQCLAICNLHSQNEEMSSFLLYYCAKLEALLRPIHPGYPNPEIDYALVARMLLNLTLAAKVRGLQFTEADKMKEHAEIILSIVKNDCESLLLQESMSSANLRKLRDALVKAEKWTLALELSLKCGFATSGVMAAWGMTCLRAGCYETAREKFSYCLQKLSTDADNSTILNCIESPETKLASYKTAVPIKRPTRSPPLLLEIISILESTAQAQPPEVIARASMIKSSNTSLSSSMRMKGKENIPLHEPALNVLNTLSNLKHITKGNFTDFLPEKRALRNRDPAAAAAKGSSVDFLHALDCIMSTRFFEESMYYLLTYGAHQEVTSFLIRHRQILPAMKYALMQQIDPEVFLHTIVLPYLKNGKLETVIQVMSSMDETLLTWKTHIIHTCRYLETNRMLNCLYNLQLLLKDPIRASMTCVRFYSMDAKSFTDLEGNTFHLRNSVAHLQAELELCNWVEIHMDSGDDRSDTHKSLLMKMEPKELNNHINTILRQLEVTKFLAKCEYKGKDVVGLIPKLFIESSKIPTLFGSVHEKLQLAVLILICGQNIEEGFGLSYRVIQDFSLNSLRVYGLTAKYFINHSEVEEVEKLMQAIVSNSTTAVDTNTFCDELIKNSVEAAISTHGNSSQVKTALEGLIKRVSDTGLKIHCYIVTGQLKTAYLLANKNGRIGDIRKILRQAEVLNQVHVKRLCETKLAAEGGSKK